MTESSATRLSWCPLGIGFKDPEDHISYTAHPEPVAILPQLPDNLKVIHSVFLPMENLLTRTFKLPLKQTRHLDAAMLAQELADTAGINPDEWWLSWQAHKTDRGISGIAFGLPKTLQNAIAEQPVLQQTPIFVADGWARLNSWLENSELTTELSFAVIDSDAEGVFFGFYHAGAWQGMRRLNADINSSIGEQVLWSLQAMGFEQETMPVSGRLTPKMVGHFPFTTENLPLKVEETLPQRHMVNLMLPDSTVTPPQLLNLRHGKWAVRSKSAISQSWNRPIALAASVCLIWFVVTTVNNFQLEAQLQRHHDEITSAFHRGLPDQPVIIDALAQLRQASNQNGGSSISSQHVTQQLSIISTVFEKHKWQMQELSIDDKGTTITGKVKNLDTLNTIRENLEQASSTSVRIVDTDLSSGDVTFKVQWQ